MKPPKTPFIGDYITDDVITINPGTKSHKELSVPEIVFEYGKKEGALKKLAQILPIVIPTMINMRKSNSSLKTNPETNIKGLDPDLFSELKAYALKLGCTQVGFTKVPNDFIFRNKKILFPYAIVLTMEMDKDQIAKTPKLAAGKEVWRAYRDLGIIVNKIAHFLRKNGIQAQAGPALGGDVNYPLLAEKAGLGRIGKHGLLISEPTGPCQRIAAVYTNIENMSFTDTEKHNWINDYCDKCNICVKKCPADAIYEKNKIFEDGTRQCIDYKKCA